MRRIFRDFFVSIAAGAVTYAVFEITEPFGLTARVVIAVGVAIAAFAAVTLIHRSDDSGAVATEVGADVSARRDISLEDVEVRRGDGDVRVGTRWRAGGDAKISGVRVDGRDEGS